MTILPYTFIKGKTVLPRCISKQRRRKNWVSGQQRVHMISLFLADSP